MDVTNISLTQISDIVSSTLQQHAGVAPHLAAMQADFARFAEPPPPPEGGAADYAVMALTAAAVILAYVAWPCRCDVALCCPLNFVVTLRSREIWELFCSRPYIFAPTCLRVHARPPINSICIN